MNFPQETVIETLIETEGVKPKPEAKSRAKPKHIKLTKEPVEEPVEPIVEEPIVDEKFK